MGCSAGKKVAPLSNDEVLRSRDRHDDLPPKLVIHQNVVVCQAASNPSGDTVIVLVTPKKVLARQLNVTSNSSFCVTLKCSHLDGEAMKGPNKDMKMDMVNFGKDCVVTIQFLKQMEPDSNGCCCCKKIIPMTDFGTVVIPQALKGYLIVFFWPDEYPGDGWKNFILDEIEKVQLPRCVMLNEEAAGRLRAAFEL